MTLLLSFAFASFIDLQHAELELFGPRLAIKCDLRLHCHGHIRPLAPDARGANLVWLAASLANVGLEDRQTWDRVVMTAIV